MPGSPLGHYMVLMWELLKQSMAEVTWTGYVKMWGDWCRFKKGHQLSEFKCTEQSAKIFYCYMFKKGVTYGRVFWVFFYF